MREKKATGEIWILLGVNAVATLNRKFSHICIHTCRHYPIKFLLFRNFKKKTSSDLYKLKNKKLLVGQKLRSTSNNVHVHTHVYN